LTFSIASSIVFVSLRINGGFYLLSIWQYAMRSLAVSRVWRREDTNIMTGLPSLNFLIWLYAGLFIVAILGQ